MTYLEAMVIVLVILILIAFVLWGIPLLRREKPNQAEHLFERHGGPRYHVPVFAPDAGRLRKRLKENYGEPPGLIRAVHRDELGFRGWSDMPGDYEGSTASAMSAFIDRSA